MVKLADDQQRNREMMRLRGLEAGIDGCLACGACTAACPVADWDGDRLDPRRAVRLLHYGEGQALVDQDWIWHCTTCGRCASVCPSGIPIHNLISAARSLAPRRRDPGAAQIQKTAGLHLATSNNMGLSEDDWLETVEWMADELRDELPDFKVPIERPGARHFVTINSKLPMYYPADLQDIFKIFHVAGASWTLARAWWEGTNYAMFTGDDATWEQTLRHQVERVEALGCHTMAYTECGHGYFATLRGYQRFGIRPRFAVHHVVNLYARWIREGRLTVDPDRNPVPVTIHDPCNAVRKAHRGGYTAIDDDLRYVLNRVCRQVVEMTPNREANICCSGGGGALLAGFRRARVHFGRSKVAQIDRTEAPLVCTPCVNCYDGIANLGREFKRTWEPVHLWKLVANAMVL